MITKKQVEGFLHSLPGKRGIDIPADIFDKIHPVANGITQKVWGSAPTPHQLQHLYETGAHEPQAIQDSYNNLPHPLAPSVSVGEYQQYSKALELYNKYQK